MNWDVFRAYDIRGVYPDDINEEDYYRTAKGYVYLFKPKTMVVGMDARASSPPLKASLIRGFLDSGVDVVDIGQITTDMLYFTAGAFPYSGGIVVSANMLLTTTLVFLGLLSGLVGQYITKGEAIWPLVVAGGLGGLGLLNALRTAFTPRTWG